MSLLNHFFGNKSKDQTDTPVSKQIFPWRTFSIFISSTFADMQAERDYLKIYVFPKVAEELRKKRISLEIVDLRWGVDTVSVNEEEREATVLKVCLDEIRRCKPFFIGLLGDRYGWVPSEERMLAASTGQKLVLPAKNKSVTALEMEFGVLASTEQLTRSVFYLRERLPYDDFTNEKAAQYCDDFDPKLSAIEKRERNTGLIALKEAIRTHYSHSNQLSKVKPYKVSWDKEKQQVTGLESWGEQVLTDILTECAGHAADTWDLTPHNPHEEQQALLDAFIESHTHVNIITTPDGEEKVETFCGRENLLIELSQFLLSSGEGKSGIILTGESGSGKSAIFSRVYRMMERSDCFLLAHSVGISPEAQNIAELLRSWNKQLSAFLQIPEETESISDSVEPLLNIEPQGLQQKKTGIEKLQERFAGLLLKASVKTSVVMLIDALDRFEPTERAKYMTWLPKVLPLKVRVLITAITGTEKRAVEFHASFETKNLDHFTQEEAKGMLNSLCKRHHKNLSPAIEKLILSKMRNDGLQATSSPLWLSLAVNILMTMDADDFQLMSNRKGSGGDQIESYLHEMADNFLSMPGELFLQLIERAKRIFGLGFTQTIFNAIACSRSGLRESDLESLFQAVPGEGWDALQFANLRRWFSAQLTEDGEGHQWNLAHSILRNTLRDDIATENSKNLHHSIANHLLSLPTTDTLRISETMYHLMQADDKRAAIGYYVSELDGEALLAANKVLAEIISKDESGLIVVAALPELVEDNKEIFPNLLKRFIYELNDFLKVEGNINQRVMLLSKLHESLEKSNSDKLLTRNFAYNLGKLYSELGIIYLDIGHLEEALNYSVQFNKLAKEFYDAYPQNDSFTLLLSISYQMLGNIHKTRGNMEEALYYFVQFNKSEKELHDANPQNEFLKHGLAISYQKLGDIHQTRGNIVESLNYFVQFNKLEQELYEANPQNESLKNGLAISYLKLGNIHQTKGNMEEALNYIVKFNKLEKELYDAKPQNESLKNGLAISYKYLGDIHETRGNMEEALNYFVRFNKLEKELYNANSQNESLKNDLAISYQKLGDIHQTRGNIVESLNYFVQFNMLEKELYETNPQNESLKHGLAFSYQKLGNIHQTIGDIKEALYYFVQFNKLEKELTDANSQNESFKRGLAISYKYLGDIHQTLGNMEEALNYFVQFNKLEKELYNANSQNESLKNDLAISYQKLGDIHQMRGNMEEALNYFVRYNKLEKELYDSTPQNELFKNNLSISYQKLGDIHQMRGNMEEALNFFVHFNKLEKELYEANNQTESFKDGLASSYQKLGDIHQTTGNLEEALNYFVQFNKLEKELYEANPQNESLKHGLAISYEKLGDIHQTRGNIEEALNYFVQFNRLEKELYVANPQNESLKFGLTISYQYLGDIHQTRGNIEEALNFFLQFNKLGKELYEANPQNETLKHGLAASYQYLGNIYQTRGNIEEALYYFVQCNKLEKELYDTNDQNINLLEGLGLSYYKLAMIYKTCRNNKAGKECFLQWKKIISSLSEKLPLVVKYKEWDQIEYISQEESSYEAIGETSSNDNEDQPNNNEKPIPINQLIRSGDYQKAMQFLLTEESKIRKKLNNSIEFQANMGDQALVLSKMGKYKESIEKYEIQAEICARNQIYETYTECLISQAKLLIKHMKMLKRAKSILNEAILIAQENNLKHLAKEAENILKEIE